MPTIANSDNMFRFFVPYSNPMYFGKIVSGTREYRVWDDALANEQFRIHTQKWAITDRLSFQFSWENYLNLDADLSSKLVIKFYVNNVLKKTIQHVLTTQNLGTRYSDFVIQEYRSNGKLNGVYGFSQIIGSIDDGYGNAIISEGDCFYIEVTDMKGVVWRSNVMACTSRLKGTKLIHYSNTCASEQTIFDTYFGYMVNGYDMRLDADYCELTPVSEVELMETYTGGKELISAIPSETVKINIGDNAVGIPRYYMRTLNVVFCCDEKSIDGENVELSDGGITITSNPGYANDMYSCVIVKKDNSQSYHSRGASNKTYVFVQTDTPAVSQEINPNIYIGGLISIKTGEDWYIDSLDLDKFKPQRVSGGFGNNRIGFTLDKNTSGSDITYTGNVYSQYDGSVIGTFTIVNPAVNAGGIGAMQLGDTFIIR